MIETLKNAWKIADLRKRLLFTALIILIFRIGTAIPVPFLNPTALQAMVGQEGSLLGYLNTLTGGAFANATLFAMSISPYITASIVVQLLTVAIPYLERLAKEGEAGRKQINKITRYATVILALVQSFAYYMMLRNLTDANGVSAVQYTTGFTGIFAAAVIILAFTAGAMLVVWLGEQIDDRGVGNGISIILFAGIISRGPAAVQMLWEYLKMGADGQAEYFFFVPLIVVLFVVLIGFIVVMTTAERRVPVQYAKRQVGRKIYGGQSSHIPIKVNMSGVMPIIFASAILSLPTTILGFVYPEPPVDPGFWYTFFAAFRYDTILYAVIYFVLIIGFNYFYIAVQYNPIEMANNIRQNNGTIPGIRPGRPTSDFLTRVIGKVTLLGAIFLAIVAILPIFLGTITGMNIHLGGTSIIIVVGVALDTVRRLESQMMMRHYKGFLE